VPHTCFSIEPGIYLAGDFGIRSEIDVFLDGTTPVITGGPAQRDIIPILALPPK
jgi:Xaa-Pro aminopeptidase